MEVCCVTFSCHVFINWNWMLGLLSLIRLFLRKRKYFNTITISDQTALCANHQSLLRSCTFFMHVKWSVELWNRIILHNVPQRMRLLTVEANVPLEKWCRSPKNICNKIVAHLNREKAKRISFFYTQGSVSFCYISEMFIFVCFLLFRPHCFVYCTFLVFFHFFFLQLKFA